MKIFFFRHAETKLDFDRPVSEWILTKRGHEDAMRIAATGIFDSVQRIISSDETKAKMTAQYVCERLDIELESTEELNELYRGKESNMTQEEYRQAVKQFFENGQALDWESLDSLQSRVTSFIDSIQTTSEVNNVLIVAHGINLTTYFAQLQGVLDTAFERWKKLKFCAYGIVENGIVVRDIVL
ncbi:MAG: hypothetical protein GF411_13295 [Candidatus Lokiarchaeota archaeon]|nr:hypothetical protein [Candidatus Lokiarchaeota archaeon]